ncbi:MAG: arylsulfatase [Halobacteriaceae archaeon]
MTDESERAAGTWRPPNVVHVVLDDLGYADLGCYGGAAVDTPNLDRLAENGTRFTQAYAGAPVCAPSRSVLMTGRHTGNTPVRGNTGGIPLDSGVDTVADVLSEAGYATGGFGKWGLGDVDTGGVPEANGFDEFFGYYHQVHAHSYYPEYLVDTGERVDQGGERVPRGELAGPVGERDGEYSHYAVVDRTLAFVDARADAGEPFYCYAPWTPPHGPMQIPADDPAWRRYADEPWPEDHRVAAAMLTMVDRQVGDLLELLEDRGVAGETLVLFSSDHGAADRREGTLDSCGALRGRKRDVYEGGIRTPLLARWPGTVESGRVSYHPVHYADVLPTLAELAGVPGAVPDDVDGHSVVPELLGPDAAGRGQPEHEYLYWSLPRMDWAAGRYAPTGLEQAVRAGDWKLLRHDTDEPWELYNLSTDPVEERDLADANPGRVERLRGYVEEAQADRDPRPEPETPEGKRFR